MRAKKTVTSRRRTADRKKSSQATPPGKEKDMRKEESNSSLPPFAQGGSGGITDRQIITIYGVVDNKRVPSRILEEHVQQAVSEGARALHIVADGQHGIGGRIWPRGENDYHYGRRACRSETWQHGHVRHGDYCQGKCL